MLIVARYVVGLACIEEPGLEVGLFCATTIMTMILLGAAATTLVWFVLLVVRLFLCAGKALGLARAKLERAIASPWWRLDSGCCAAIGCGLALVAGAQLLSPHDAFQKRYTEWQQDLETLDPAIEQFRIETGRYPSELSDLVPEHLPRVPLGPGGRAVRLFVTKDEEEVFGNPWYLTVAVPDEYGAAELRYHPNGRYRDDDPDDDPPVMWGEWELTSWD